MLKLKKVIRKATEILSITLGLAFLSSGPTTAQAERHSTGPTLLTIAGKIGSANRGASDEFEDAFFNFHDISFKEAYAFDQKALETLPQHTITVQADNWPKAYRFEGPLLSDVLSKAGVETTTNTVTLYALDGYAGELSIEMVNQFPAVLALKADGQYLGLGGRGPIWLVMPVSDHPELQQEGDAGWVWSAFFIEAK